MSKGALVIAIVVAVGAGVGWWWTSGQLDASRIREFNIAALVDTTRTIYRDSMLTVQERLAFQSTETIRLAGAEDSLTRALESTAAENRERGRALIQLQIRVDSLTDVETIGAVSVDPENAQNRVLTAALDTNGVRVEIDADVPAPPARARVRWQFSMDPLRVVQTITETPDGAMVWRSAIENRATVLADSIVIQRIPSKSGFDINLPGPIDVLVPIGAFVLGWFAGK